MHSTYPKSPGFAVPDERPILAVPRSVVPVPGVGKWIPPLILVAAAAVLALFWDGLPVRWAVHWGLGGQPNGWATKTSFGVFGPLVLAAVVLLTFCMLAHRLKH